jgi:hypothetical protein
LTKKGKNKKMLRAGFALVTGAAAGLAGGFYQIRKGKWGEETYSFNDTESWVHTVIVDRGFFQDTLTVFRNHRTDKFIYDYEPPSPKFELDMARVTKYESYQPIKATVIAYERAKELDEKLKAARIHREGTLQERKTAEKMDLLKIIREFT